MCRESGYAGRSCLVSVTETLPKKECGDGPELASVYDSLDEHRSERSVERAIRSVTAECPHCGWTTGIAGDDDQSLDDVDVSSVLETRASRMS